MFTITHGFLSANERENGTVNITKERDGFLKLEQSLA